MIDTKRAREICAASWNENLEVMHILLPCLDEVDRLRALVKEACEVIPVRWLSTNERHKLAAILAEAEGK